MPASETQEQSDRPAAKIQELFLANSADSSTARDESTSQDENTLPAEPQTYVPLQIEIGPPEQLVVPANSPVTPVSSALTPRPDENKHDIESLFRQILLKRLIPL